MNEVENGRGQEDDDLVGHRLLELGNDLEVEG